MGKGFLEWMMKAGPDIVCLQETKLQPGQVPLELASLRDYGSYFSFAEKKGYSGVAALSRQIPELCETGLGDKRFDTEGRTLILHMGDIALFNIYFPNGKKNEERLRYKMEFYDAFLERAEKYRSEGKGIIMCGDVNTAHTELDLARPKENENVSGFLPVEREWMDRFVSKGYIDTFRELHPEGGNYSWWDYKTRARERNIGWRIDYFFISEDLRPRLKDAFILSEVPGSDHCPVGIDIDL